MDRVESRTGVVPVAYLENSTQLKQTLSRADAATKAKLRRMPYARFVCSRQWRGAVYPAPGNPNGLVRQYDVWSNWTMWQYGGVDWQGGRSQPKVYNHGVVTATLPTLANLTARRSEMSSMVRTPRWRRFGSSMGYVCAETILSASTKVRTGMEARPFCHSTIKSHRAFGSLTGTKATPGWDDFRK